MRKRGVTFKELLKKWWWLLLLPLLFVLKPWNLIPRFQIRSNVSKDEYSDIAERLYNAMYNLGTNYDYLIEVLKPLNSLELRKVYYAFGVRKYWGVGRGFWGLWGDDLDLFEWFSRELRDNQKTQMANIWEKTGMVITFYPSAS